ncbi:MAG TPA: hypothetical protein VMU40_07650 [Steroidobacteraceae bacterium]|nr:hypothetical protein [Steroidobacteraceae bacterium]
MKVLMLTFAALLTGCDAQLGSNAATQSELASINQHMAALDGRMSALEQTIHAQPQAASDWILWQIAEVPNGGYPQAWSGYSSKSECTIAAGTWSFPGGKPMSQDPVIFQLKGGRVRLECLPVGVTPYAH